jgi:hypothetical protein
MIRNFLNNSSQVREAAEKAVVNYLKSTGWKVKKIKTGFKDIEAIRNGNKLLIQVTSTIEPNEIKTLSKKESEEFKLRASKIGADAIGAKVVLDNELEVKKMNFYLIN